MWVLDLYEGLHLDLWPTSAFDRFDTFKSFDQTSNKILDWMNSTCCTLYGIVATYIRSIT